MSEPLRTEILNAQKPSDLKRAAQIIKIGGLVAFRTETVYGLGADATNPRAVAAIYAAKGRPSSNPVIVHAHDLEFVRRFGILEGESMTVAHAFWPGPLTLLAQIAKGGGLAPAVTAGQLCVALRIPATASARALIELAGCPIAAPSANRSGKISPTTAAHVIAELEGRIDAILDDGPCDIGVESTIFDPQTHSILREGSIDAPALQAVLGKPVTIKALHKTQDMSAPGQMPSHYAPTSALRLSAIEAMPNELWIGFGQIGPQNEFNLSVKGDLDEAGQRLYAVLRMADALAQEKNKTLAIAPIEPNEIGRAINDRLVRAAAPREV